MAQGAAAIQNSAIKALQKELKELSEKPVEGFRVKLVNDSNLFEWDVVIFGPPNTLYENGYFKAQLKFPPDYPYSPPSMKFISEMFHPNIYENGDVCISILHSPGDDPQSGELPSERWNPTQNVRTILLSVISMLNEPNVNSAAHVDASVSFRKWYESKGKEGDYDKMVKNCVKQSMLEAAKDNVEVPRTVEEYCNTGAAYSQTGSSSDVLMDDDCFLLDEYEYDDDEDEDDDCLDDEGEDSGTA